MSGKETSTVFQSLNSALNDCALIIHSYTTRNRCPRTEHPSQRCASLWLAIPMLISIVKRIRDFLILMKRDIGVPIARWVGGVVKILASRSSCMRRDALRAVCESDHPPPGGCIPALLGAAERRAPMRGESNGKRQCKRFCRISCMPHSDRGNDGAPNTRARSN